jgi:hypothetical protein
MSLKIVLAFVLGCAAGGGAVLLIVSEREPARGTSATQTAAIDTRPALRGDELPAPDKIPPARAVEAAPSAGSFTPVPTPVATQDDAAQRSAPYNFNGIVDGHRRLEDIFRAEPVDQSWSAQTVDSLNLVLSAMPERAVIGDYALSCRQSLCKLEIRGDPKQLASAEPKNNVQGALLQMMAESPASEIFDDSMMQLSGVNSGLVTLTLYAHRRPPKR